MTVTNKLYRDFLERGEIQTFDKLQVDQTLSNIDLVQKRNKKEARSLFIILYLTGARPAEVFKLKPLNITKEVSYLKIMMPGVKRGLTRPIYIPLHSNPYSKELWQYASRLFPDMYMFYHFMGNRDKVVSYNTKDGVRQKTYKETSHILRWHFAKWVAPVRNIIPYFLRHNRFSKLSMNDVTLEEIRQIKGAKSLQSVMPYSHLSSKVGKKIGRKID